MPPPQIPADLVGAYGVKEKDVRFLTRVQNYIFAYQRDSTEFILRLTPDTHQSAEQVMAEVEWVNDLAARDIPVAGVVPALDGLLARPLEIAGERFTAVSFQKVEGEIGNQEHWTPATFVEWGRLCGQLHRESRTYQPVGNRRASWAKGMNRNRISEMQSSRSRCSLSCGRSAFILFSGNVGRTGRSANFSAVFLSRCGWGW